MGKSRHKIGILGCGWLGLPLARRLAAEGYPVKASTTTEEKLGILEKAEVEPFLIDLQKLDESDETAKLEAFFNVNTLVVTTPPSALELDDLFLAKFSDLLTNSSIERVLYISSTSVYGLYQGEVDENSATRPEKDRGTKQKRLEDFFMSHRFPLTILRAGGLVGQKRHPAYYLSGKKDLPFANAPVNLIHQDDMLGIIEEIFMQDAWGDIFNCVCNEHRTREDYYTEACFNRKLEKPHFAKDRTLSAEYKIVLNDKVKTQLGYQFFFNQLD